MNTFLLQHMSGIAKVWMYLLLINSGNAFAHSLNDSYLNLTVNDGEISGSLQLALDDLEIAIGLDADRDNALRWSEILVALPAIEHYVFRHFDVSQGTQQCSIAANEPALSTLAGGTFLYLPLSGSCESTNSTLQLHYALFTEIDSSHRGIAAVTFGEQVFNQVFSADRTSLTLEHEQVAWLANLGHFIVEGVWHIWIGIDHVLFVVAMLMGVVLQHRREQTSSTLPERQQWQPLTLEVIKLVTAFTVAHSVTLILASLEWVLLPIQLVEATIALTVVISGINIVYPVFRKAHWQVAFGFGFIHGFGFANVLADLDLAGSQFFVGLLGFNLGVEIGQLAIVVAVAPILLLLTRPQWARRYGSALAGLLIANIGVLWFLERIGG
jgi:hypothetical protein